MEVNNGYFLNNERMVNQILLRCAMVLFFVGPILAVFRYLNMYDIKYIECLYICLFDICIVLICMWLEKYGRWTGAIKYLLILGIHIGICFVATKEGMTLYIAYALMPALSCLYFDRKFTLYITEISYMIMLGSMYLRSYKEVEVNYPSLSPVEWFGAFSFGLTFEFILLVLILYTMVSKIQDTLIVLQEKNHQMKEAQKQLVTGFANLLESRDEDTGQHVRRTSEYVRMIAEHLREKGFHEDELSGKAINDFVMAEPLHDAGKISVPDSILRKKGKLTEDEYDQIKHHTTEGYRLVKVNLSNIGDRKLLNCIENTVLYHHEWWDGSGYPKGIGGEEIPLCARIMAAADSLDALLSERCYKKGMNISEVMNVFEQEKGKHFEPCIVDAILALQPEIEGFLREENNVDDAGDEAE